MYEVIPGDKIILVDDDSFHFGRGTVVFEGGTGDYLLLQLAEDTVYAIQPGSTADQLLGLSTLLEKLDSTVYDKS